MVEYYSRNQFVMGPIVLVLRWAGLDEQDSGVWRGGRQVPIEPASPRAPARSGPHWSRPPSQT